MKTLAQQAETMLETLDKQESEKKFKRLTAGDRALILRLAAKANISQAAIAQAVGCDPSTVSRVLQLLDTRKEARTILESCAAQLAHTVVETDDAGIALKALGKLDVVREDQQAGGNQLVVMLGTPEQPLQPPAFEELFGPKAHAVIDVQAVPDLPAE